MRHEVWSFDIAYWHANDPDIEYMVPADAKILRVAGVDGQQIWFEVDPDAVFVPRTFFCVEDRTAFDATRTSYCGSFEQKTFNPTTVALTTYHVYERLNGFTEENG